MTSPISQLNKNTFEVVLDFLSPVDWGRASKVCRTWNLYINQIPSISEQLTIIKRLPKVLQLHLPNRKLPVLFVGGVIDNSYPDSNKPLLQFGGEKNWPTNKINSVTTEMMTHSIVFIKDSLQRVGVAIKFEAHTKKQGVLVLHEVGGLNETKWTSGINAANLESLGKMINTNWMNVKSANILHLFPEGWNLGNAQSVTYLQKLIKGEKCGFVNISLESFGRKIAEATSSHDEFIQLADHE